MKNLVLDISAHGLGHMAQVAPVIRRLMASHSNLNVVIRSDHAPELIHEFVGQRLHCAPLPSEPILEMDGPLSVNRKATEASFTKFHDQWERNVRLRAERLATFKPDVLVADIPYVSLAAANRLSIPSIALCSYNWRDARRFFTGREDKIDWQIEQAYQSASIFLQPIPHMPMDYLLNRRSIGPIARRGLTRSEELRRLLGLQSRQKMVLVTFGGIAGDHSFGLPEDPEIFWIAKDRTECASGSTASISDIPLPFIDILASVDAVVSKEGYGTLTEAACNGARLLMLTRQDWPETPYFISWAEKNVQFHEVPFDCSIDQLHQTLIELLSREPKGAIVPHGILEAADTIAHYTGL
jgi:hypothetical protein